MTLAWEGRGTRGPALLLVDGMAARASRQGFAAAPLEHPAEVAAAVSAFLSRLR
jgi:hypothetical protein